MSVLWRPYDTDFIENPYPAYSQISQTNKVIQAQTGEYVILDFELVRGILIDPAYRVGIKRDWLARASEAAKSTGKDFSHLNTLADALLFQRNGPEHSTLRGFLMKEWPTKEWMIQNALETAEEICEDLMAGDWADSVAREMPFRMVQRLLGVKVDRGLQMSSQEVLKVIDPYVRVADLEQINQETKEMMHQFDEIYEQADASDEGLAGGIKRFESTLIELGVDPVAMLVFVFLASQDTTSYFICQSLHTMLDDKSLATELTDAKRIEALAQEVLRLHAPVQLTDRICHQELNIDGTIIPKGACITLAIGAANRDPKVFDNSDELVLDREVGHLSFGYGLHHCLGHNLAMIQTTQLLKTILPKLDTFKLDGELIMTERLAIRSVQSMHVVKYE